MQVLSKHAKILCVLFFCFCLKLECSGSLARVLSNFHAVTLKVISVGNPEVHIVSKDYTPQNLVKGASA